MDIIKNSLVSIVSSIIRTLLVSGLTWLTARNLIDESTSSQLIAVGPIVAGAVIWSLIEKYVIGKLHLEKIGAALNLPQGSTPEELADALKKSKADTPTT